MVRRGKFYVPGSYKRRNLDAPFQARGRKISQLYGISVITTYIDIQDHSRISIIADHCISGLMDLGLMDNGLNGFILEGSWQVAKQSIQMSLDPK